MLGSNFRVTMGRPNPEQKVLLKAEKRGSGRPIGKEALLEARLSQLSRRNPGLMWNLPVADHGWGSCTPLLIR